MLDRSGLREAIVEVLPLTGGVSSDIVRVVLADGSSVCAKRALPRLKVASVWEAPLERNHFEAAWLRLAGGIVPGLAPKVLDEDQAHGVALLEFLPPDDFLLWKADLLRGRFDPRIAPAVASALARIHAATWDNAEVATAFATDDMFDALRLSPYLRTLAERTPDLSVQILAVVERTAATRMALVHGDVSPKNILVSRRDAHPVLLDAECAWYGDPAFDAAFCMNHLLLKAVHVPIIREQLLGAAMDFFQVWSGGLPASRGDIEARVAALLPCLMLARVDGKSPVEYLGEPGKAIVRAAARPLIANSPASIDDLVAGIRRSLSNQRV
ncbi:MAG: phosphotransferase [Devosia nanyangense]|uniref:Phosphotransferase n=1 Tax=Devosia nanyangense TaxID=1228055 RepID=A0A933L0W4_9HYPH|nr:phosphotransferase [Devosia nanyangense]